MKRSNTISIFFFTQASKSPGKTSAIRYYRLDELGDKLSPARAEALLDEFKKEIGGAFLRRDLTISASVACSSLLVCSAFHLSRLLHRKPA